MLMDYLQVVSINLVLIIINSMISINIDSNSFLLYILLINMNLNDLVNLIWNFTLLLLVSLSDERSPSILENLAGLEEDSEVNLSLIIYLSNLTLSSILTFPFLSSNLPLSSVPIPYSFNHSFPSHPHQPLTH